MKEGFLDELYNDDLYLKKREEEQREYDETQEEQCIKTSIEYKTR